jgi:hypothetical protein
VDQTPMNFTLNYITLIGIALVVYGFLIFLFPPKFGNIYLGFNTLIVNSSEKVWFQGQKLMALALIIMAFFLILLGNLKGEFPFGNYFVFYFIVLWKFSKFSIEKYLIKKASC